jgi:hypothetical protein
MTVRAGRRSLLVIGAVSVLSISSAPSATSASSSASVSIWYRGQPTGTPRADELAVIRALGFSGVTWPAELERGRPALEALAATAGLQVTTADASLPLRPGVSFDKPRLDLRITAANRDAVAAIVWRAVAHGTRTVAFDAGSPAGHGLERPDGSLHSWVRSALDVARQFAANDRLFASLQPGPGVTLTPAALAGVDITMLDAGRAWLVIATNSSPAERRGRARLPSGVPYAIWVEMLDGSTLAMVGEPAGPLWPFTLPPRSARLYLTDKKQK